jgi:hypothetical protein
MINTTHERVVLLEQAEVPSDGQTGCRQSFILFINKLLHATVPNDAQRVRQVNAYSLSTWQREQKPSATDLRPTEHELFLGRTVSCMLSYRTIVSISWLGEFNVLPASSIRVREGLSASSLQTREPPRQLIHIRNLAQSIHFLLRRLRFCYLRRRTPW